MCADTCSDHRVMTDLGDAEAARLAALLKALCEPTRLRILDLLARQEQPLCVCEITPLFRQNQPTISHHLGVMVQAGLATVQRRGVWAYYTATQLGRERLLGLRGRSYQEDETMPDTHEPHAEEITRRVREHYAAAARCASAAQCCSGPICACSDPVTKDLYTPEQVGELPDAARLASLGCGNPSALIELQPGETVLDLGSGGGIDVLLSARRVGPTGFAYGVDLTDEMLALALANKERSGLRNVAFLRGRIEDVPLPSGSVDVVISNCVINLSADKLQTLREAFRVLRPGGRLAIADVVAEAPLPEALRCDLRAWAGCLAGAVELGEYRQLLANAGFASIDFEILRRYDLGDYAAQEGIPVGQTKFEGQLASAFIRAIRPVA